MALIVPVAVIGGMVAALQIPAVERREREARRVADVQRQVMQWRLFARPTCA